MPLEVPFAAIIMQSCWSKLQALQNLICLLLCVKIIYPVINMIHARNYNYVNKITAVPLMQFYFLIFRFSLCRSSIHDGKIKWDFIYWLFCKLNHFLLTLFLFNCNIRVFELTRVCPTRSSQLIWSVGRRLHCLPWQTFQQSNERFPIYGKLLLSFFNGNWDRHHSLLHVSSHKLTSHRFLMMIL